MIKQFKNKLEGYIADLTLSEADIKSICENTDLDGNGQMDYTDFTMGAVDLTKNQFYKYCEKAFEIFFNNDIQQVDKQEFIEQICMQNMKKQLVEKVLAEVDANQNESITFDEFVELILEYLQTNMPDY